MPSPHAHWNTCWLYAKGQPHTITLENNREISEKNESAALEPIFPDKTDIKITQRRTRALVLRYSEESHFLPKSLQTHQ